MRTRKVGMKHEQDLYTKRYITASQSLCHGVNNGCHSHGSEFLTKYSAVDT
jgi:hypothetical protein